jgi:Tfp pilus assembly protein PilN
MNSSGELSFLPEDYLANRARQRAIRLALGLLVVVTLGVGAAFAIAERSLSELKSDHEQVTEQYLLASNQIKQFDTLRQQQEELSRRARLAASLVEQMPRSAVFAEVRSRMPGGVSLTDMNLISAASQATNLPTKVSAPSAATPAANEAPRFDVRLKVSGVAQTDPQVAAFMEQLNASKYFTDVSLLISQQTKFQSDQVRKFEIELRLADAMPAEIEPGRVANTDVAPLK